MWGKKQKFEDRCVICNALMHRYHADDLAVTCLNCIKKILRLSGLALISTRDLDRLQDEVKSIKKPKEEPHKHDFKVVDSHYIERRDLQAVFPEYTQRNGFPTRPTKDLATFAFGDCTIIYKLCKCSEVSTEVLVGDATAVHKTTK